MNLTEMQRRAVIAGGSVAVTAGAGTGKTAMLAARYLHHVVEEGLSPIEIAAVTFTEKAAAELRSRIRAEIRKNSDEAKAAEVDAAQISTMHSLAGRICRDFYDLAGIPPDFTIADETDARIRQSERFAEAIAKVDPAIITKLGYTWLSGVIAELLNDPISATAALEKETSHWEKAIDAAKTIAFLNLQKSVAWCAAATTLWQYNGAPDDKLEVFRVNVVNAMADILSGNQTARLLNAFDGFRSNIGAKGKWLNGGLDQVRSCLTALRSEFKNCLDIASLEFGAADEALAERVGLLQQAFSQVRAYFAEMKRREKILDYADLEYYALEILKHREAGEHYSRRWRAILIDEFQDTNPVQEQILNLLSGSAKLTVVGDDKQSIYGFRRADEAVFKRFRNKISTSETLSTSFRAHLRLTAQINSLFEPVLGHLHDPLDAARVEAPHQGPFIHAITIVGEKYDGINFLRAAEGDFIAAEIGRMLDSELTVFDKSLGNTRPVRPGDIAILSRTRAPLDIYIEKLLAAGITAVNTGGGNLLETREAKDAVALLNFAADRDDGLALVTLLRSPFFGISDRVLYDLASNKEKDQSWWNLLQSATGETALARDLLQTLLDASKTNTAERLLEIADCKTGYTAIISNLPQGKRRMADWLGFLSLLRKFAALGRPDVFGAARYIRKLTENDAAIPRPPIDAGDAVSLMTIHGAKGLEWPVVFIPDLARKNPPNTDKIRIDDELGAAFKVEMKSIDKPGTIEKKEPAILKLIARRSEKRDAEEAKRILYVAATRARDRVYLTSAGEKGPDLALLLPGMEAAGISIRQIAANEVKNLEKNVKTNTLKTAEKLKELQIQTKPLINDITAGIEKSVTPANIQI